MIAAAELWPCVPGGEAQACMRPSLEGELADAETFPLPVAGSRHVSSQLKSGSAQAV